MAALRRPFLLALLLLTSLGAPARAAEWPVPRGPSHEPHPFRYDPRLADKVPRDFLDDAAACVLYSGNSYLVEPDGTIESITHEVTRLNGRKGVDKLGEFRSITYDPAYQKLTLNEAVIHKADGRRVAVEPRHVQLRDVSTDYQVYDHEKQLIISFPSLEVGDTVEVKWTLRGRNPEHGGHFFTRYTFGDPSFPVAVDEVYVRLPRGRPFRHAVVGGRVEEEHGEDAGQALHHWKAVDTPQLPQDEDLPPKEELRPSLVCSTFPSWEEVGRWKQRLRADAWEVTPELRQVVRDVTRGLSDPAAKARALTYWVRRNVRYVSVGETHDYTPHPPGEVLANRFGDCKDTSQLLAVMLREAGVPVALATLGTLGDGQVVESVPSPWGTHAILLATVAGKDHWVDTTLSLGGWDFLPREDRDRLCYVVGPEGDSRLVRTPPLTCEDNRTEQTTEMWVAADGSSRNQRTAVSFGSAALAQREAFVDTPAGERRRQVSAELQDANSRTHLIRLALNEGELRDYDRPVTARMAFEIPGHFGGSPDKEGSLTDSKVWGRLLAHNLDYDRPVALDLSSPFESRHRYVVHLPPGLALEAVPRDRTVASPWGRFELRVKAPKEGPVHEIELDFLTRLEKTRVEPARFDEFRRFHEQVVKEYRAWLTLKPAQGLEDAPLLEAAAALAPEDASWAAALARLYLAHGQPADARRVLRRARFYRPDDAALGELAVQAAATRAEEEAAQRELVTRFPDESKYAVDLGSILVDEGKHAEARKVLAPLAEKGKPAEQAQAHFHLARSCQAAGAAEEALRHLDAAERADPEGAATARALLLRGRVLETLGRGGAAAEAYRRALAVEHDDLDALDGLVRLALVAKNRAEALDYLRRYAVAAGDDVSGQLRASDSYLRLGMDGEAYALASRAAEAQPVNPRAQRILGLVCLRRGEEARALRHLEKADPDADVLAARIRAALPSGTLDGLADDLERADKVEGLPADLRDACADARRVLRRRDEVARAGKWPADVADAVACAEYARAAGRPAERVARLLAPALRSEPAPGPAYALRARLALDSGKLARAAADAAKAVEAAPGEPWGYYVRGRVRLERGAAGAQEDLKRAAELTGWSDGDVLHAYADALYRGGAAGKALDFERQAAKLKPNDREIAEQLAEIEKATQGGSGGR
jgi:tetratricopeptide (TPR) repeat protein